MNTYLRPYIALLSCCLAAFVLAACVTDRHESLRTSVANLDDASSRFSAQILYQGDDSRRSLVSRDAEVMAKAARNLHHVLNEHETHAEVEDSYRHVADSYEQLHAQLADEGYAEQNRRVLEDFDRVTAAYRDVQSAMSLRTASLR